MLELKDLIILLPNSLKIEFVKEYMNELYLIEQKELTKWNLLRNYLSLNFYLQKRETYKKDVNCEQLIILLDKYKCLVEIIKEANLSDEDIKDLYIYSKNKRKELKLEDNLFNIDFNFINSDLKEKNLTKILNKKFNRQMNI